jgi:hypothetical protein
LQEFPGFERLYIVKAVVAKNATTEMKKEEQWTQKVK